MTRTRWILAATVVIIAATDPVAGSGPSADGPDTSGLVAMNRAPPRISRTALVIASKEYVRVSPSTTKSGSTSVIVYPASCSAVVKPASPITYADPPGN